MNYCDRSPFVFGNLLLGPHGISFLFGVGSLHQERFRYADFSQTKYLGAQLNNGVRGSQRQRGRGEARGRRGGDAGRRRRWGRPGGGGGHHAGAAAAGLQDGRGAASLPGLPPPTQSPGVQVRGGGAHRVLLLPRRPRRRLQPRQRPLRRAGRRRRRRQGGLRLQGVRLRAVRRVPRRRGAPARVPVRAVRLPGARLPVRRLPLDAPGPLRRRALAPRRHGPLRPLLEPELLPGPELARPRRGGGQEPLPRLPRRARRGHGRVAGVRQGGRRPRGGGGGGGGPVLVQDLRGAPGRGQGQPGPHGLQGGQQRAGRRRAGARTGDVLGGAPGTAALRRHARAQRPH